LNKITIAICTDENYALNGAMTLYSAAINVKENTIINAYVVDAGIKTKTRKRFERTLDLPNVSLSWLKIDLSNFVDLPISPWTSKAAHVRLMLPGLLAGKRDKLLYLDSDMMVLGDISKLWEIPMNGICILACQDGKYPQVENCQARDILVELGMKLSDPYFNSGLLLINILRWQKLGITKKTIRLLQEKGVLFSHKNQDALNVVLLNEWNPIDIIWNVGTPHFFSSSNFDKNIVEKAQIIHFTGRPPGFAGCVHPRKQQFNIHVKKSGWFIYPEYLLWKLELIWKNLIFDFKKLISGFLRKIKSSLQQ